ncbi:DUF445 family protein [Paenibacillus apis]|uniref:UPF0754 membrane protein n=1 Tax=Paenibacillus apis TaxID=1792174 RepID=A0A920CMX2_9BACL|nr:DUF445 family protein [Paenibacillus apis]GIO42552.1 UPF0754 membrane protein [Paenibacillus apis]
MDDWLYVLVTLVVSGFVGGITNHYAIKMLFHPRRPVYIGKWHVPFTPGLIPKRRDDIAKSLGKVVAEYLVTPEGVQEFLVRPSFRAQAEERIKQAFFQLADSQSTVREILLRWMTEDRWESLKLEMSDAGRSAANRALRAIWEKQDLGSRQLKAVVPGWTEENRQRWSEKAAEIVIRSLEDELLSSAGQKLLTKLAGELVDKTGGFLGAMAAIFVDEDKLVRKLTPVLLRTLHGKELEGQLVGMIRDKLEQFGEQQIGELLELIVEQEPLDWLKEQSERLPVESWIRSIEQQEVGQLIAPWKEKADRWIPSITGKAIELIGGLLPAAFQAIRLPSLVQEQVEKFPIERLEEIILSLSGKEFRAITWLGVLLGGMIGLIQALFIIWTR